jgi:Na+-translocating ferredoxin:NAD+ oxidoreductase RnfD subunit
MSINSPFLKIGQRSSNMALWTLGALLVPSIIYSLLYKSPFVLQLLGYAVLGSLTETIYTKIIKKQNRLICSGSALSAALLAASLPPGMPFWPMLLAILITVMAVKLPMTGLPLRLNAAMTGRLFLMIAFPEHVVNWGTPTADVVSTATPQELYRSEMFSIDWQQLLFGKIEGTWEGLFSLVPGSPGETFPLALLLLGGVLYWKGISSWRAPMSFVVTFFVMSALTGNNPVFNLFSAATIFTAIFIVSDPVSSPMSKSGQLAFGCIVGLSNALLREFTYYTEAIAYAVLIGNFFAPLLDYTAFEIRGRTLRKQMS